MREGCNFCVMKNDAFLLFTQLATVKGNERRDRTGSKLALPVAGATTSTFAEKNA